MGRALHKQLWTYRCVNYRDFAQDKHRTVDDTVYGGGPGMVMKAEVVDQALKSCYTDSRPDRLIYLSPRGVPLTQEYVKILAQSSSMGLLCGRFEGIDQRVLDAWEIEEVSIGDFVLCGGEVAAMALLEAVVRVRPEVVGDEESLKEESFSECLLEYPQFTRPSVWQGRFVPDILLTGHHEHIKAWRKEQAEQLTKVKRPDLWLRYCQEMKTKERESHE